MIGVGVGNRKGDGKEIGWHGCRIDEVHGAFDKSWAGMAKNGVFGQGLAKGVCPGMTRVDLALWWYREWWASLE